MTSRDPDNPDPPVLPFTIVVDENESMPYHFTGIPCDSDRSGQTWIVPTVVKPLWAMGKREVRIGKNIATHGWADYSIDGLEALIQVERKSVVDLYSTLAGRRIAFQAEMAVLDQCDFAAVVVEGDWPKLLLDPPGNTRLPPKVVARTIMSWSIRYPRVHWFLCMHRRHAELATFHLLLKFWEQREEKRKELANGPF